MKRTAVMLIALFILIPMLSAENYRRIFLESDSSVFPDHAEFKMKLINMENGKVTDEYDFTCFLGENSKYLLNIQKPFCNSRTIAAACG